MVDIIATMIYRVIFGQNFVAPASIIECDYRLKFSRDRNIMHDVKHQSERVKGEIWIIGYISPLGDDSPWIEGHGIIKKAI